jgi:hypothetical protein
LSITPNRGIDYLLRSFPNGDYGQFIRKEWQQLWTIPDWNRHDFVHWMFLWDEQSVDVHLYYEWSAYELLEMIGKQERAAGQHSAPLEFSGPPYIVPEDLVPPHLGYKPFNELHREWIQHAYLTLKYKIIDE